MFVLGREGSPASSGNGSGLGGFGEVQGYPPQIAGDRGEVAGCGGGRDVRGTTETPRAQEGVGGCIHFVGQDQTLTQSGWEPGESEEERPGSQGQPGGWENVCPFLLAGVATSHQHMVGLGLFWGCASVWVWLDDESI